MADNLTPLVRSPELLRTGDPFAALDFQLRLDLSDVEHRSFEECVRDAAHAAGGTLLFEMPDGLIADGIERVAAVSLPGGGKDILVFAGLETGEKRIRLMGREEVGERFFGFANAYVSLLKRLENKLLTGSA